MQELVKYIEKLIRTHRCVIIPQFGGFVVGDRPASIHPNTHLLLPPSQEVVFNKELQHNDGLLTECYMKNHHITFKEANVMMMDSIDKLRHNLNLQREVQLGTLGRLFLNERSKIEFEFNEANWTNPETYGLSPFRCIELQYLERKQVATPTKSATQQDNYIHIRFNKNYVTRFAAAIIVTILLLLATTPVQTPVADYASLIPNLTPVTISLEKIGNDHLWGVDLPHPSHTISTKNNSTVDNILEKNEMTIDTIQGITFDTTAVIEEINLSSNKAEDKNKVEEVIDSTIEYYAIISSVRTEKEAIAEVVRQEKIGMHNVGYIDCKNRFRIYAAKFTDKQEAERFLSGLRNNANYSEAWLYCKE